MRKLLLASAAAGALSLASAAAWADTVVYNGGSPDLGGTYYADSAYTASVYISFVLPAGVTSISDAEWWGGCYNLYTSGSCGSSPSFTISVLSSTGGAPGTVIATYAVGGADQTATGSSIVGPPAYAEYVYNAYFPVTSLTPGTTYFFEITGTTGTNENGEFGVETTSTAPAGVVAYQSFGGPPGLINAELALQLTSVPEPSTWAMMLLGFAGLGFLAYRKRAALATA